MRLSQVIEYQAKLLKAQAQVIEDKQKWLNYYKDEYEKLQTLFIKQIGKVK